MLILEMGQPLSYYREYPHLVERRGNFRTTGYLTNMWKNQRKRETDRSEVRLIVRDVY